MSQKKKLIMWICIGLAALLLLGGGVAAFLLLRDGDAGQAQHTEHDYSNTQVIRPLSCTEDGITAHGCSCGKEQLEILPATGHVFGDWKTDKEATCAETGSKSRTCSTCQAVQTETLPRLEHSYAQTEATEDALHYVCAGCGDAFTVDAELEADLYNARYESDCDAYHSFEIYCLQDEDYIRQHLYITDAYYHNTDKQVNLDYQLSGGYGGIWTVSPVEPYAAGNMYIASRSGEVLFGDLTVRDRKFQIYREEANEVVLADNVKFLQKLENEKSGYYPYELQYTEVSDTYWLGLKKATGLEVGDIVCVGDATCLEDVLAQTGKEDVFGKITLIRYDEKMQRYCVELACPELSEVFSVLNVHGSHAIPLGDAQLASADALVAQTTEILYQSDDFARLICSVQDTSETYLEARGYATPLSSVEDFFKSIEIKKEECQLPKIDENGIISAKIVIGGEIPIPISLTKDSDEQLGEMRFYFTATVSLDSLELILTLDDGTATIEGEEKQIKAQIGADQQVTVSFTLGVEVQMDWSLSSKPYARNTDSGKLHFANCKHVAAMKNPEQDLEYMTSEDFFSALGEEEIKEKDECKTCQPVSSMLSDSFVLNTETKKIHIPTCPDAKKLKAPKAEICDLAWGNLVAKYPEYTECENCHPSNRSTNSFTEQVLENMRSQDLGDRMESFKQMAEEAGNSPGANTLTLATVPFSLYGVAKVNLSVGVYFDFHLEATLEYNYELQINSEYGLYLDSNGFNSYSTTDSTTNRNDLTLTGKARVDVGLQADVKLTITGLDKYCYASLMARAGLYAEIHGAARFNFMEMNADYASVYFEAGLHLDVLGDAKFFFVETGEMSFLPEEYQDIPFLRYGYERLYYNFDQMPDEIQLDTIYYNLEKAELMHVKYLDIVTMEEGTDTLNLLGIQDKYQVEFSLANGTNCTVSDGYLLVNTPYQAFSDELTITVTGYDRWGKYRNGNTQYNLESCTIPIYYDPAAVDPDAGFVPAGGLEYNGHYYKVYVDSAYSWEDAKAFCENRGGHLAVIGSQEENDALYAYLQDAGVQTAYFGMYKDEQGQWHWIDAEESTYFNWNPDEPNNEGGTERYGEFYYKYTDGTWNDGNFGRGTENDTVSFICEWTEYEFAPEHTEDMTTAGRLDALVGYYHGWYTAHQGETGGKIGVHRTNALLQDENALQMYADLATDCAKDSQGNITTTFTADDIRAVVDGHTEEYIAFFYFHPLDRNPSVEDGLYTMTVAYDEGTDTYTLKGSQWIQRDTYIFANLEGATLGGNVLMGSIYSDGGFWGGYSQSGKLFQERYEPDFEQDE